MKQALLICLWSLLLTSCLKTRAELSEMDTQKSNQSQITSAQQSKADSESKLYAIQDEMRNIMGRLEVVERKESEATQKGPTNQELVEQMKIFEQSIASLKLRLDDMEAAQKTPAKANTEAAASPTNSKSAAWDQAEEFFAKKEWKNAILKYQSYRDQFPSGPNYAMATYKIGVCFQELKMKEEAKAFLEEVIQKFPKSPTAKKAKFRLNQLK